MKLVAYLRVSTDLQAEKGLGLEVQERAIRKWAKENGHRIVLWARDEGVSGSNGVEERVGLLDALAALADRRQPEHKRTGIAEGIVVYRLDRLARNFTVQETTLATIWAMGATAFSVDIGEVPRDDADDPMKTALRQMIGVFAQLEKGLVVARLRAGRRLKAEKGGYAYGSPALGWKAEGKELVPDEDQQATLARIIELHEEGKSLREIIAVLDAEGRKPKRGGKWHPHTVARALSQTAQG